MSSDFHAVFTEEKCIHATWLQLDWTDSRKSGCRSRWLLSLERCPDVFRVVRKNRFLGSTTYNRWKSGLIPLEQHMQDFSSIGKVPIWALLR